MLKITEPQLLCTHLTNILSVHFKRKVLAEAPGTLACYTPGTA